MSSSPTHVQTKPVHVYRLCTEGTVEERIQRRAEQKLYLDQMVNRGSTAGAEEMDKMDRKELLAMLKFGADRYDYVAVVCCQNVVGTLSTRVCRVPVDVEEVLVSTYYHPCVFSYAYARPLQPGSSRTTLAR